MLALPSGLVAGSSKRVLFRSVALLLLFFIQAEGIQVALRAYFSGPTIAESVWAPITGYQRWVFSFAIVFVPALLVLCSRRLAAYGRDFVSAAVFHPWLPVTALQLLCFSGFALATYLLSIERDALGDLVPFVLLVWAVLFVATAALAMYALAPWGFWGGFVGAERRSLAIAAAIAIAAQLFTDFLQRTLTSLGEITLVSSEFLLRLVYDDVVVDMSERILGTSSFEVRVTDACAGYEGMVLITLFLALYLWLFRRDFRFPAVLLMFPLGLVLIWSFNALRIAALIGIGDGLSEEVAIAGFHSNAGWIAFVLVSLAMLAVMHRLPFFAAAGAAGSGRVAPAVRAADALLVPVIVMLAFTLLSGAFSAGFDWLYPLKVLGTAAALWYFWRFYDFNGLSVALDSILIGVGVFVLWMLLVPEPVQRSGDMALDLAAAHPWAAAVWLVFRIIGSALVVPLAEELAFRGYLLNRLAGATPAVSGRVPFTWLSFLLSSVLFGVFHGAWLAGTVAGMAYAYARYRRGAVSDAVVAHMTTNFMLSMYVLVTGEWGYW